METAIIIAAFQKWVVTKIEEYYYSKPLNNPGEAYFDENFFKFLGELSNRGSGILEELSYQKLRTEITPIARCLQTITEVSLSMLRDTLIKSDHFFNTLQKTNAMNQIEGIEPEEFMEDQNEENFIVIFEGEDDVLLGRTTNLAGGWKNLKERDLTEEDAARYELKIFNRKNVIDGYWKALHQAQEDKLNLFAKGKVSIIPIKGVRPS